jgi:hypothetical protein
VSSSATMTLDALRAITQPPATCPACNAEAGKQHPAHHTTRHCARHLDELQRQFLARHLERGLLAGDLHQERQVAP